MLSERFRRRSEILFLCEIVLSLFSPKCNDASTQRRPLKGRTFGSALMLAAAAAVTWTPSSRTGPVLRPPRMGATAVLLLDDDADQRSRLATGPKEGADDAGAGREPPAGFRDLSLIHI